MNHDSNVPKAPAAAEVDPLVQELMRVRKSLGYTQQTTADLAGISRRTLNAIEGGSSDSTLSTLRRLCTALDVDLALNTQTRPTLDDVVDENRRSQFNRERA